LLLPPASTIEMGAARNKSTVTDNDRINNFFHITILLSNWIAVINLSGYALYSTGHKM
jgi:hypothetical protein